MTTTLITGASSGIGAAFARALAARGHDLVLVARRADRLEALAHELAETHGTRVTVLPADLARPEAPAALAGALENQGIQVDWLVNNAGVAYYGEFTDQPSADTDGMVMLNVQALTAMTRAFAPGMAARGRGVVLNVGSAAGFFPMPYGAVYGATKAYVLAFSEALAEELAPKGVKVFCLCPGTTESEIHGHSGVSPALTANTGMMTAEAVVAEALWAVDRGLTAHVPGPLNQAVATLTRFLPRALSAKVAGAVLKGHVGAPR